MAKTLITPQSRIKQVPYASSIVLQGDDCQIRRSTAAQNQQRNRRTYLGNFRESPIISRSVQIEQKID